MKKILIVATALMMAVVSLTLTACSNVFWGNYKDISSSKAEYYLEKAIESQETLNNIIAGRGSRLTAKMEYIDEENGKSSYEIDLTMLGSKIDDKAFLLSGSIKQVEDGDKEKINVYYDGAYLYKETKFSNNTVREKCAVSKYEVLAFFDMESLASTAFSFISMYVMGGGDYDIEYGLREKNEETFLKMYFEEKDRDYYTEAEVYLQFDREEQLKGLKVDAVIEGDLDSEKIEMSLVEWSGKISPLKKLDKFTLVDDIYV